MTPDISLTTEHCTYSGSFCKSSHQREGMLNEFKTDVNQIKELQTNENDFGIGW
jgi:hypothetical protein